MHSHFGNKSFDNTLSKVLNKVINSYLNKVTDIDYDFDFEVKSRKANDDEFYDWIIEIYTDKPIPYTFKYNEEYRKKKEVYQFHHSVLNNEIRYLISIMGIDVRTQINTVGIKFKNLGGG